MSLSREDLEAGRWSDGWAWFEPAPDPTTGLEDELEYLADAVRRTVDLRDALAGSNDGMASGRAVALNKVLNGAWREALVRRFGPSFADSDEAIFERPWDLVVKLREDGRLG